MSWVMDGFAARLDIGVAPQWGRRTSAMWWSGRVAPFFSPAVSMCAQRTV